jgi:hypothetical protein
MKDRSGFFESDLGRDPRAERIFVVGTMTGAVFVLLLWAAISVMTEPSPAPDRADVAVEGSGGPSTLPTNTAVLTGERACRNLVAARTRTVRAAERSLGQWRTHVEAMNRLVAGEITLAQASDFWERTRVGAHRKLAAYGARAARLPDRATRCPGPVTPRGQAHCAKAAALRARQLRKADEALATWATHVQHMEMLRRGDLDPATATRMWRTSWRSGVRQLHRYDRAAEAARAHAC